MSSSAGSTSAASSSAATSAPTAGDPLDAVSDLVVAPDGRQIGFVRWGGGAGVPVLLLHGVTDSAECWGSVVRHLAGGRPVVAVDARGHGRTPLGDEPFSIGALASDAAEVLRVVAGAPALVVGHSLGGVVAEELALTEPGLVAGLVLEDPAWETGPPTPGHAPEFLRGWLSMFAGVPAAELERWARRDNPTWPDDEIAPWARSKTQVDQRLGRIAHDWHGRDWVEALGQLRCPVTLVTGDLARGSIVSLAHVGRATELLGDLLVHVPIADVGHNVRREALATYLAAVDGALARIDPPA
ncbi:MAG: alpha/beta fold hydrolase [Cellulomonas sp.]